MHKEEVAVPGIEKKVEKLLNPFQRFIADQTTSSKVLLLTTVVALAFANSGFAEQVYAGLHSMFGFAINDNLYQMSVLHWVNDGLMALFFLLLGMEIKREVLVGDLSSPSNLIPVLAAAAGGMFFPAIIFATLNLGTPYIAGWGIPMATDTAFAVGILALLGSRAPLAAFSFLTGLAIIDDIGAIMVIAIFYTDSINALYIALSAVLTALLFVLNYLGIRRPFWYLVIGVLLWLTVLSSGVHATIAGILIAAAIPARPKYKASVMVERLAKVTQRFQRLVINRGANQPVLASKTQHQLADELKITANQATTPLRRWEKLLHTPVGLLVLPIFAFSNAGVQLDASSLSSTLNSTLAWGIFLGLVVGKGIGIPLMVWLTIKTGIGKLPQGLNMWHMVGLGMLGGIGFTMSIFITGLGFAGDLATQEIAKTAILFTSLFAGVLGYILFKVAPSNKVKKGNQYAG